MEFAKDDQIYSSSPQVCCIQHQEPMRTEANSEIEENNTHSSLAEEDNEASLWNERAQRSLFQLFMPFITALLFLADIVMDFKLAASHLDQGHQKWAAYTLGVVLFSLIIVDVVSASFYLSDQKDPNKTWWLTENNLQVRPWFYAFHLILCGRFVRCFQTFRTVLIIRGIEQNDQEKPENIQRYRLHISQLYRMSILSVVEAFTEEAPQVALQSYILLQKGSFDWNSSSDVFVGINTIKSLFLFSYSLLNFAIQIRLSNKDSALLKLFTWASLLYFFWRLFMLVARLLALVLFANEFKELVFIVVGVHVVFSFFLTGSQTDNFFTHGSRRDILFRYAFSCINIFCFFPLEGKDTGNWGIPHYIAIFVENSVLTLTWYFYSKFDKKFKIAMLAISWGGFFLGLVCVLLYYGFFHPSITGNTHEDAKKDATEEIEGGSISFESSV